VNVILLSYELPSAHKILLNPKNNWKPITHTEIDNFWKNKWSEDAKTKSIKVITKLPNSEQSYKGKVKTHNYINRQNQSTTGKL
jgi:hypothetical protein